jgi:hypothetical protein
MRRLRFVLARLILARSILARSILALAALLLGFASLTQLAVAQECCHASGPRTNRPASPVEAQPARMSSVSAAELRREFNASSQKVRIVALLSPTCAECQSGHAVVGGIMKKFPSPNLQALLVWEPMRATDSPAAAAEQSATIRDARISRGWNASRDVGKLFGAALDLDEIAWDVYLIYKPGIRWEGEKPPRPTFWMHQLDGADPSLLLCANPSRLGYEVGKLLGQPD